MPVKISIIGAGSAVFSLNMIRDICQTPGLSGSDVCFMDIDESRLNAAFRLCQRFAAEKNANVTLRKTMDRADALRGADFVINTALASPWRRWQEGWKIAGDLGYRFGGSMHIVHDEAFWINYYQLTLMESITQDILEYCPNAWLLMVANPVLAGVTYLKRKYPALKLVGMCHGFNGVYGLADMLGFDPKDVTFELPGVNHFIWLTKFRYRGEDAFPMLDRFIAEKGEEYFKNCPFSSCEGQKPFDLYRRFGAFPVGDTANVGGGAWGYFYHTDAETEKFWNEDPYTWFDGYFEHGAKTIERIRDAAYDENVSVSEMMGGGVSHESMIPFIEAVARDKERVIIVNIQNDAEYVPGVPRDFEVEIPALVSGKGVQGIRTDGLPKSLLAYLLRDRVAPVEMELMAYEQGSYEYLLDLVMMDPWTRSDKQARALLDAILDLPYHPEMKAHYKR